MQTIYLPPTPPDDRTIKNLKTPPAIFNPLTPDSTPPGMRHVLRHPSNDLPSHRSEAAPKTRNPVTGITAFLGLHELDQARLDGKTPEVPGAFKEAEWESCIPVHEQSEAADNTSSTACVLPILEPQSPSATTALDVYDIPVRQRTKKRVRNAKRRDPHSAVAASPSLPPALSGDWNDLPPDMHATNYQGYQQNQHSSPATKMEPSPTRQKHANVKAVEVVVLQPQLNQKPALRHVKKRRALRSNSKHSVESLRQFKDHSTMRTSRSDRSQRTLTDQKPDESVRENPKLAASYKMADTLDQNASITTAIAAPTTKHTLRHERRPLSAGNRSPTSTAIDVQHSPGMRHASLPVRLQEVAHNQEPHILRHFLPDQRIEREVRKDHASAPQITPESPNLTGPLTPSARSHRFANTHTPLSVLSDRTDMELCMAKNVSLFPHSNDSVFLIESSNMLPKKHLTLPGPLAPRTFRPLSLTFEDPESVSTSSTESVDRTFSTPEIRLNGSNVNAVDSPLTNPRAAPEPPAIKFIPPTPSSELDRQLSNTSSAARPAVERSNSLITKARRFSGSLITPFFPRGAEQYRRSVIRSPHVASLSDNRLHPMWVPTNMWDDDDYSDSEDDVDPESYGPLPAGGDTSEHPAESRGFLPRQMSVRMPGFRGNGGFLLGNSLGVERHGTNRRRPHVELPARGEQRSSRQARFGFLRGLRERVAGRRLAREEAAQEKRRMQLKDSIGLKIVHQTRL